MMMATDKTDHCSCIKDPGVWGCHGVHWREHDDDYIEKVILFRWQPEWGGKVSDNELRARLENTKNENMQRHIKGLLHLRAEKRAWLQTYKGQAVFVCLCEKYVAASREARAAQKKQEALETYRTQAGVRPRG